MKLFWILVVLIIVVHFSEELRLRRLRFRRSRSRGGGFLFRRTRNTKVAKLKIVNPITKLRNILKGKTSKKPEPPPKPKIVKPEVKPVDYTSARNPNTINRVQTKDRTPAEKYVPLPLVGVDPRLIHADSPSKKGEAVDAVAGYHDPGPPSLTNRPDPRGSDFSVSVLDPPHVGSPPVTGPLLDPPHDTHDHVPGRDPTLSSGYASGGPDPQRDPVPPLDVHLNIPGVGGYAGAPPGPLSSSPVLDPPLDVPTGGLRSENYAGGGPADQRKPTLVDPDPRSGLGDVPIDPRGPDLFGDPHGNVQQPTQPPMIVSEWEGHRLPHLPCQYVGCVPAYQCVTMRDNYPEICLSNHTDACKCIRGCHAAYGFLREGVTMPMGVCRDCTCKSGEVNCVIADICKSLMERNARSGSGTDGRGSTGNIPHTPTLGVSHVHEGETQAHMHLPGDSHVHK